ncbi:MAG: RNA-binding protein [Planctomycetaceae bacterium]|nr:RNA-binding protein [Planctomycetaceae bacterium]
MLHRLSRFSPVVSCLSLLFVGLLLLTTVSCRRPSQSPAGTENHDAKASDKVSQAKDPPKQDQPPSDEKPSTANPESKETLFSKLAPEQTGIHYINRIDKDHPLSRLYISGFASGGVAIGDIDGDGLTDIYLTNGPDSNRLYRQVSKLQFEDITDKSGVSSAGNWSAGSAFADVDGDGDLDLYVCNYDSPNQLYINDGTGIFVDEADKRNAALADASVMAHFCDYDNDGDLDYLVLTNRLYRAGGLPTGKISKEVDGVPQLLPEYERYYHLVKQGPNQFLVKTSGRPNRLFENDGQGNYRDVSEAAGLNAIGKGLSATWYDYDLDGRMDIYVANDFDDPDHLYRNNGDGTFSDVIQNVVPHTTWFSMGSDSADLNNDGMPDLMVLDMSATTHYRQKVTMGDMSANQHFMDHSNPRQLMRNSVFLNAGVGRFLEMAHLSGLASSDWSWAVKLADFDNDGWNDVFITNGMTTDMTNADRGLNQSKLVGREEWQLVKDEPQQRDKNLAFQNSGHYKFKPSGQSWGVDHNGMSYSAAYGDLDQDGDLDLIVTNLEEPVHVYRNDSTNQNRVTFALKGKQNNRFGIGAKVRIKCGQSEQVRVLNPMTGFMSSNQPIVHFGLGNSDKVDHVQVEWPNGQVQELTNLAAGKHYVIEEDPTASARPLDQKPLVFGYVNELQTIGHTETPYDDFSDQPLLPNKLSQLGPGLAIADVNGDERDDVYVSAAADQAPTIHLRGESGLDAKPLTGDQLAGSEEFAPLFFDADGDGDLDLYVVSGGIEAGDNLEQLRDRLYLNDGNGEFSHHQTALADIKPFSGSVAAAADFDRDGDLDLFIGGRVIPGAYPLSPGSMLLENQMKSDSEPRFVDATQQSAPQLKASGMVTSALWSDINSDGWVDLLVTTEWGPVRTFLNQAGKLTESTEQSGLANHLGWWNGIAGRDFDNDGDIDYVATNFGLNTKYHPSADHPSRIYYGTFGDETVPHIVEAKVADQGLLPVRGKSCSQNAMPFVREKFGTYHDFALASLTDIYSDTGLDAAEKFEANWLESAVLINDGNGQFEVKPLPKLAQISPAFGVVTTEVNGDGNADLYLVQNFYHPQRETGKMAGGMSVLLYGDGQGGFSEVWPKESGLAVSADAKGLSVCDLNDDAWADFATTINNGPTLAFRNNNGFLTENRPVRVRLTGKPGNPTAIGARITLKMSDGSQQTDEVRAGGGYLSQSTPDLFFGIPSGKQIKRITVRWPDGTQSEHQPVDDESKIVLTQAD